MKFSRKLVLAVAALAVAGVALAANLYPGFQSMVGAMVDVSTDAPVIVQSGQTISAQVGGANVGQWVATGTTTAAGTLTFADAAPHGRFCALTDETHGSDAITQTNATSGVTVVTIAGTITSGDQIAYQCDAF